jgi:hypothetical protein
MTKTKLLILLILIAWVVYCLNQESDKPTKKKILNDEPWLLVNPTKTPSIEKATFGT